MKDEPCAKNEAQSDSADNPRFLTIEEWVGTDELIAVWNESVQFFSPIGELQQLILQRPIDGGPILVEATASRGTIPIKPLPQLRGNLGISAMWLGGNRDTDTRERLVLIAWQQPIEHFVMNGARVDQSTIERLHFERFRVDEFLAHGQMPYDGKVLQSDRPDLIIETDQARIGVDCCQFLDEEAKLVHVLFDTLKVELMIHGTEAFKELHGSTVTLLFGYPSGLGMPPKRSDIKRTAQELAGELAEFVPKFPVINAAVDSLPDQFQIDMRTTSSGIHFYAQQWLPANHKGFCAEMGFDLTFAYSMERLTSDSWNAVRKLMKDHDSEGFDHLLVSIGAPDKDGMIFSGECVWFHEMLRFPEPIERPVYLSKIIFHDWSNGQVHELTWIEKDSTLIHETHGPVRHT